MARAIDASRFGEILEQWKKDCLEDNDIQGAEIISDVILQLDDMPTLTPPNKWVNVEDRMPEPGSLIVYADVCIDEVAYGVLRVPQGKCHKVYNYWMCLSDRFNRRPPEEEI